MKKPLFAKSAPEWTLLGEHLLHVKIVATCFASYMGLNAEIAANGAVLHDIGKAHPVFQDRLKQKTNKNTPFRHEIASLFFLSAFPENQWDDLIEMVVGHHKSVFKDGGSLGLLDLEEEDDYLDFHLGNWEQWSEEATSILREFNINVPAISRAAAKKNLDYCIDYCNEIIKRKGYSTWRGLLMGADHFASSLIHKTASESKKIFKTPNLSFYNRQHPLYPLSYVETDTGKKHTIIIACTGAGKTDFLFRRCKNRVFYTLPFQASINAMYKRVGNDLEKDNPGIDIRVLHSTSSIIKRKEDDETVLQNLIGSAVKILTPHQLVAIALGMKGYEAMILDLKGCDIILDEIHTYSGISQALVLKLIEVLISINCNIHIGTATMPSILYNRIKELLGDDLMEVKLSNAELDQFDRHIIHKINNFEQADRIISLAVSENKKILIVRNTIQEAQEIYTSIKSSYAGIPLLLLHSKFKRKDRNYKERQLIGLDDHGRPVYEFNTSSKACIVVSTQIVEVSLDISFDLMVTATAPLDALIQRFGRINRKRDSDSIGKLKDIYVVAPPDDEKEARPYELNILKRSFEVLEDGKVLKEKELQEKIDTVFTEIDFLKIEEHSKFKNGAFTIPMLTHRSKAALLELLKIDSVSCITESDLESYENGNFETRLNLEIPVNYWSVHKMSQAKKGNMPFIIPDDAYCPELGLSIQNIKEQKFIII